MTLDQLRIFVAVAEREHVTRAAQALNLAQSAVSHAIAALEAQHQVRLFERRGRGIVLTEAGIVLLTEARTLLAQVGMIELALSDFSALKRGTLSLHASQTIASYWLPRHLAAFHAAHPQVRIRLEIGNSAAVVAAVQAGTAELGFVEGDGETGGLARRPVARDRLLVVVGPGHPWADGRRLAPADLAGSDWVLREPGSGTRAMFEDALIRAGVAPSALRIALELPSNEAVRGVVEAGLGATCLSASVAAAGLEAGLLRQAGVDLPDRRFHLLHHPGRPRSRAALAFAAQVEP
ncbi:LysR family transcriptional regulator [Rhodospirillum centenum]|uniref:Transcriptional regulator, LysR family protein n=1 Tax=Rhodospirillum centenum (strain ATCC 51521 / SW) TaxID=414684 RepID=B6IPS9_RHOCS|nr:LysR family transcriptional regulator [Rhodospirillum centenum]ACI97465.1 transcriptional regulator, LysR family protein [Rhodospirillum centenum SW]